MSCMPAAADGNHGGDVGLAAQAAATRGSRTYGLSPPLRGIEVHLDSPPTPISDVDHKTRLKIMELFSHAMDHRSRREIHA